MKICNKIKESFDKCITKDSDILQGCVWRINLDEIESIEILQDEIYTIFEITKEQKKYIKEKINGTFKK